MRPDQANERPDHQSSHAAALRMVINASGVVVHTNLGRSALSGEAIEAVARAAGGYCDIEFDLATGCRQSRGTRLRAMLAEVVGAEAAAVVNNNAAAVWLALAVLAGGKETIVSRGELIEIGGSCRLPDIIRHSGSRLVEVGATNGTRLDDYERAITDHTAMLVKSHLSNYRIVGEIEEVPFGSLAALARRHGVLTLHDIGSGLVAHTGEDELPALRDEPAARDSIAAGADLVAFSGDKLLGGPQAGILAGRRELIDRIVQHPLARVVRVDKMTMSGLAATIEPMLRGGSPMDTTSIQRASQPMAVLEERARRLVESLPSAQPSWRCTIERDVASIGGGSVPGMTVPTVVVWLDVPGCEPDVLDHAFRHADPPVVGRFRRGQYGLDVLTLLDGQVEQIVEAARRIRLEPAP